MSLLVSSILSPLRLAIASVAIASALIVATQRSAGIGPADPARAVPIAVPTSGSYLPGRAEDVRVARITYRLATIGRERCPIRESTNGLVLQHLSQFKQADRASILAAIPLDRGPGVIALVPDSPAARGGILVGDVLVAINGTPIPPEPDLARPFDSTRAHVRGDVIADLLDTAREVTLLRAGKPQTLALTPVPACPSRVHLARSTQRNAFADGRHVFLTTGVLAQLRNDDELAFLIAHEMAHNILGHAAAMRGGTVEGRKGVRQIESAADRLAGNLMIDAEYDPVIGAAALRRLGGTDLGLTLFAKHEPPATRIAAMRALVEHRRAP
jgi:hypothetical protein